MVAEHIAFVLTRFARGGMEMRLADVVNRLDKTRWNPHIYAFYDHETLQGKVESSRLHTPLSTGKYDLTVPLKLARDFHRENTRIVWTLAQGLAAGWGRLGALMAGVPVRILSVHDNYPLAPLTRLFNPFTDAIVALTQHSAALFRSQGVPEHKIHVLYNGIDTEKYAPGADRRADL
ncbi:MAG: glycosyltransferase, partial [Anaerolineae bacterium]|nr:glycosyltransferase [Anaerolineae bacterium]